MSISRLLTPALILLTLGATFGHRSAIADERDKFVGTWKLVSAVNEEVETGRKTNIYKETPTGFITSESDGRVMTLILDSNRKKPAGALATSAGGSTLPLYGSICGHLQCQRQSGDQSSGRIVE